MAAEQKSHSHDDVALDVSAATASAPKLKAHDYADVARMSQSEPNLSAGKPNGAATTSKSTLDEHSPARSDSNVPEEHRGDAHMHDTLSETTATDSSDEFSWSDSDFSDSPESTPKPDLASHRGAKRGRAIWLWFMKLSRTFRTLLVGLLGAGVFITPLLVFQLRFRSSVAQPHAHAWSLWIAIIWASSCATYLIVDLLPQLVVWTVLLFGGQVERLKMQIELIFAVLGWIKLVLDITWAWIALGAIRNFYNPPGSYWVVINRVMQALFAASVILLAEKVFLRFVAINFHQRALADRLTENRLGLKALDRLSNAQTAPHRSSRNWYGVRRGHNNNRSGPGGSFDFLGFGHSGHATPRRPDGTAGSASTSAAASPVHEKPAEQVQPGADTNNNIKRHQQKQKKKKFSTAVIVDQLSGAIGQVALKNPGKDGGGLTSARKLARKLFARLDAEKGRKALTVEDFYPYFSTTAEAHTAFAIFDKDGNGDLTKKEMREAVQRIYRERKALTASLKDVGSIVAKFDAVLVTVALVAIAFICLLIFKRKDTLSSLVPLATIILGFSFIFGHSAQTLFESLIFIFSTHVFDVGDLVMIDDQPLVVREFGLFSTTFRRVDGQEIIAPNSLLGSSKLVHNLRRSSSMWETTNLTIAYSTPLEVVETLKQRIGSYMAEHNREWSGFGVNIDSMEYQNSITLIIAMEHRPNWQDWGGRWGRRTAFMRHLKTVLEELDIKYTMPVQPILLPRHSPYSPSTAINPHHGGFGSVPTLNLPPQPGARSQGSREELGNAGGYRGSETILRPPTRTIRSNPDTFGSS